MKVWDVRSIRSQLLYWPRLPGNGVTGRPSGFGAVVRAPGVAAPVTCITLDAKPPSCRGIKSGVVTSPRSRCRCGGKRLANRSPRWPQAAPWQPNHRGWPWYAPGLQGPVFNTRSCSDDQPFSGCPGRLASPVGASLIRQAMDANPILVPWHTLRRAWWRRGPA